MNCCGSSYLDKLTADDANLLSECWIHFGLLRDLNAQAGEVGEEGMMAMGLGSALKVFGSKESVVQHKPPCSRMSTA